MTPIGRDFQSAASVRSGDSLAAVLRGTVAVHVSNYAVIPDMSEMNYACSVAVREVGTLPL